MILMGNEWVWKRVYIELGLAGLGGGDNSVLWEPLGNDLHATTRVGATASTGVRALVLCRIGLCCVVFISILRGVGR